jgi:hypothetical protein
MGAADGDPKDLLPPACTAKAEKSFSARELLHFSESIDADVE